jgi:hypothetical protein
MDSSNFVVVFLVVVSLSSFFDVAGSSSVGTPINPWIKFACTPENMKVGFFYLTFLNIV